MKQLELPLDGPQPISKWLHVWSDAERARRIKSPAHEAQGEGRSDPAREDAIANEGADK